MTSNCKCFVGLGMNNLIKRKYTHEDWKGRYNTITVCVIYDHLLRNMHLYTLLYIIVKFI